MQRVSNRLRPQGWLKYNDRVVQMRTVELLKPLLSNHSGSVVLSVGVGHGGLFSWLWRDATRIGIDINHEVMVKARAEFGLDHFSAVEGDALHCPSQIAPSISLSMTSSFTIWSGKPRCRMPLPKAFACCGQMVCLCRVNRQATRRVAAP